MIPLNRAWPLWPLIKGLADTAKQLVRAYAQQQAVIEKLGKRVKELEEKAK